MAAGAKLRHFGPVAIHAVLHPRLTKEGRASETRIDLDNCLKLVADALNGILWHDDRQIVRVTARKIYAETAQTILQVADA